MVETVTSTLSGTEDEAPASFSTCPVLYLAFECDRPLGGGARYVLDGVDVVEIGRGVQRRAEMQTQNGRRRLRLELPDRRISSRHASLRRSEGVWTIEDLGSKNGVFVEGERVERAALTNGARIEVGHTFFTFRPAVAVPGDAPRLLDASALDALPLGMATLIPSLARRFELALRLASSTVPILLLGESGTGKELVARALHAVSARAGRFVAINCGALPANLVESELFGYRKGAFSGATEDRSGLVRSAENGTLFLDEIGDFPLSAQASLLRVLQEREVMPVGATRAVPLDLRVISATHGDLEQMVEAKTFRADLFARLAGGVLRLPPLRERLEDLGTFLPSLLRRAAGGRAEDVKFSAAAARALLAHDWPLNVRQLEKSLAAACAVANDGNVELEHLPEHVQLKRIAVADYSGDLALRLTGSDLKTRERLLALLEQSGGNVSAVARQMGKGRTQIQRWMRRYGIKR